MKVVSLQWFGSTVLVGHRDLPYDDDKGIRLVFNRGGGYVPVWLQS